LYYTASGTITPVGGRPVHGAATYRCDEMHGQQNIKKSISIVAVHLKTRNTVTRKICAALST